MNVLGRENVGRAYRRHSARGHSDFGYGRAPASEGAVIYDDVILSMVVTPEIFSNLHCELVVIATVRFEGFSSAKTDAAIKIKGLIFLEFANSLRSRRDRFLNVRRHHPK